jgi:metallo-beta-lactamase class B
MHETSAARKCGAPEDQPGWGKMKSRSGSAVRSVFLVVALVIVVAAASFAQAPAPPAQSGNLMQSMNQPVAPFRIIGNIYYVGASDITSYLIVTPAGDILLDGGFVETAPQIEANIQTLGFKLADVKIILSSHEHLDHAGGIAEMKRATGAQFLALEQEVPGLTAGTSFPAANPDRVIHDGEDVKLGNTAMTAHLTPGHTRGCTTWSTTVTDRGKSYNVVFVGSVSVLPQYKLIERPNSPATYPGIQQDYEKAFRVLRSLPCDVFLGSHGQFYSLVDKRAVMAGNHLQNPFIDPWGYQAFILRAEATFQKELQTERAAPK